MFFLVEQCANDRDVMQAGDNVPSDDSYHKQGEQISAQGGHDAASNCWRLCTGTKFSVLVFSSFIFSSSSASASPCALSPFSFFALHVLFLLLGDLAMIAPWFSGISQVQILHAVSIPP